MCFWFNSLFGKFWESLLFLDVLKAHKNVLSCESFFAGLLLGPFNLGTLVLQFWKYFFVFYFLSNFPLSAFFALILCSIYELNAVTPRVIISFSYLFCSSFHFFIFWFLFPRDSLNTYLIFLNDFVFISNNMFWFCLFI